MRSHRASIYLRPALLAAPPVVMIGALFNSLLPSPQPVSAVVAANDPEVGTPPLVKTSGLSQSRFKLAGFKLAGRMH